MRSADAGALCLSASSSRNPAAHHQIPEESCCHEDKHKAPTQPHIRPLSLQNWSEHSISLPHLVSKKYANSATGHVYFVRTFSPVKMGSKSVETCFYGQYPVLLVSYLVVCYRIYDPGGRSGGPKVTLAECISMQRNVVRNSLFIVTSLLLFCTSLLAISIAARADQSQPKVLSGQIAPLIVQAQMLQTTSSGQQLNLSIGLQPRNAADLNNLLNALYDPQSPQYHQYLTPDQFEALFAPTPDQVQQVVTYLQSQGMTVTSIAPNNMLIDATGSVAQADQAFSTIINNYQLGSQVFYANATPPVVPATIS